MLNGVQLVPRTRYADDRGYVTEILRSDEDHFRKFGQAYVTACYPGVVKAWHRHGRQIDYFFAICGTVKVGLYDDREGSPTRGKYQTVILGERGQNAQLVIPAGLWHGLMALDAFSIVLNIPTEVYDREAPDEERVAWDAFDDIWTVRNR